MTVYHALLGSSFSIYWNTMYKDELFFQEKTYLFDDSLYIFVNTFMEKWSYSTKLTRVNKYDKYTYKIF